MKLLVVKKEFLGNFDIVKVKQSINQVCRRNRANRNRCVGWSSVECFDDFAEETAFFHLSCCFGVGFFNLL